MTVHGADRDNALFARIAEGDERAFRELFHLYAGEVRPLIFHITKAGHIVDDILQDVFLKIWLARDTLEAIETPSSWILKITFNECFGYMRKKAVRQHAAALLETNAGDAFDPVMAAVEAKETADIVADAIDALPQQARKVYLLSRQDGMKLQDIADHLGLSLQTVKNTMGRALKALRDHLEKHGIAFPLLVLWHLLK